MARKREDPELAEDGVGQFFPEESPTTGSCEAIAGQAVISLIATSGNFAVACCGGAIAATPSFKLRLEVAQEVATGLLFVDDHSARFSKLRPAVLALV